MSKLCLICNHILSGKSDWAIPDESIAETWQTFCQNLGLDFDRSNMSSLWLCFNCKKTLKEWKQNRDEEIQCHLRCRQLKATLIAHLIESRRQEEEKQVQTISSRKNAEDAIRQQIFQQFDVRVLVQATVPYAKVEQDSLQNAHTENSLQNSEYNDTEEEAGSDDERSSCESESSNSTGSVTCLTCGKTFTGNEAGKRFRRHRRTIHLGEDILLQNVEEVGPDQYKYRNQVPFSRVDGDYSCGLCNFKVETGQPSYRWIAMASHMKEEHLGSVDPNAVEQKVEVRARETKYKYLGVQFTVIGNTSSKCEACSKVFSGRYSKVTCKKHIKTAHADPPKPGSSVQEPSSSTDLNAEEEKVEVRGQETKYKYLGVYFTVVGKNLSTCGACSKTFKCCRPMRNCKRHIRAVHKGFQDPLQSAARQTRTGRSFAKTRYVTLGIPYYNEGENGEKWTCGACSVSFVGLQPKKRLKKHIYGQHKGLLSWSETVTRVKEGEYLYRNEFPFFAEEDLFRCGMCQSVVTASNKVVILNHLALHYAGMLDSLPAEPALAEEAGQVCIKTEEETANEDQDDYDVKNLVKTPSAL